ncbi:MAG: GGDEF domain-containing protein, partial [Chloroflexota bacterium]
NHPFVLMMLDIDNFKQINDLYGHSRGDEVLRGVGQCFQKTIRDTDFISRIGGDEFAIILPESDSEHAKLIKQKLNAALDDCDRKWSESFQELIISVSIGYASFPYDSGNKESLFEAADQALYKEKV